MDELKRIVADNLMRLRTAAGWTQAELAEQIHYSDKSVSKWERADAIPDAAVLKHLAALFGVTVDYLLAPHDGDAPPSPAPAAEKHSFSVRMVILAALAGIWTAATLIFALFWIFDRPQWIVWVAALPVSLIALLVFNSLWHRGRHNMWIVAGLVLSLFLLVYVCLGQYHIWQLFLVLVPAEAVVFFSFHIRHRKNKR